MSSWLVEWLIVIGHAIYLLVILLQNAAIHFKVNLIVSASLIVNDLN